MKNSSVVSLSNRWKLSGLLRGPGLAVALGLAGLALALQPGRLDAQAATNTPPVRVSYQGFLTDGTGTPLGQPSAQNYTVDFRLYSSPNSASILWSERQVVTVDKGNFSVILGEGAPISGENNLNLGGVIANSADASERYIGLTVTLSGGTQNTLQPRLRLLTTPYAFLATTARSVTDAAGTNRLTWSTAGRGRIEVNGDLNVATNLTVAGATTLGGALNVSGVISGNGSGLTGLTLNNLPGIDGSKITSGTLDPARIPSLDASKIASGKLTLDRIPIIPATNIGGPGVIASTYLTNVLSNDRLFASKVGIGFSSGTPASALQVVSANLESTGLRLDNTAAGGHNWIAESTGPNGTDGAGRYVVRDTTSGKTALSAASDGSVNAPNGLKAGGKSVVVNNGTATETLRIVRGTLKVVYSGIGTPTITTEGGSGFTTSAVSGNRIVVTFSTPFSAIPTVTITPSTAAFAVIDSAPATSGFTTTLWNELGTTPTFITSGTQYVHFIAIGP